MAQAITLNQGTAPHLKGEAPLIPAFVRELGGSLVLLFAGVWCGGLNTALFLGIIWITVLMSEVALRFAGFLATPKWDTALFQQTILLALFLPAKLPLNFVVFSAITMALTYRISGGRAGMILSPVCLALAIASILKYDLHFVLNTLSLIPALVVFGLWTLIRFPCTSIEAEKWVGVLILAVMMFGLWEMPLGTALLWSVAAGEVIFDSALMPLGKSLRLRFQLIVLLLALFFSIASTPEETLLFLGLIAGFIAAAMEQRVDAGRKHYGKA